MKPRVALLLGDATGIGPELVAKLLTGYPVHDLADLVVIGDQRVFEMGQQIAKASVAANVIKSLAAAKFGTAEVQFSTSPVRTRVRLVGG
jgi:4-hydroxythreonine-4-phosphate dehydrogenase